jgi:hypothetical protein
VPDAPAPAVGPVEHQLPDVLKGVERKGDDEAGGDANGRIVADMLSLAQVAAIVQVPLKHFLDLPHQSLAGDHSDHVGEVPLEEGSPPLILPDPPCAIEAALVHREQMPLLEEDRHDLQSEPHEVERTVQCHARPDEAPRKGVLPNVQLFASSLGHRHNYNVRMNRSEEQENSIYFDFLALKKQAVKELEEHQLTRLESEVEYLKEENRYLRAKMERAMNRLGLKQWATVSP